VAAFPLNVMVLLPWLPPKLLPLTVTDSPTGPEFGERRLIVGDPRTVKVTALLGTPSDVTTIPPVVAPAGTGTTIEVALQEVGVAEVPLKVIVLLPCVAPKLVPVRLTVAPTTPATGERVAILGVGRTVKPTPLLFTPSTLTTTFPVVAPVGTDTTIEVSVHVVIEANLPLNVTELAVAPKFVPVIVTVPPIGPEFGERLAMFGAGTTVKLTPLLAVPLTVTTTLPVVAPAGTVVEMKVEPHEVRVAAVPLNVTVLVP
jgi:hypothetical protein